MKRVEFISFPGFTTNAKTDNENIHKLMLKDLERSGSVGRGLDWGPKGITASRVTVFCP